MVQRNSFIITWKYLPQILPFLIAVVLSLVTRNWYISTDFTPHLCRAFDHAFLYILRPEDFIMLVVHHRIDFTCINISSVVSGDLVFD
jgi:hypothetical protein